MGPMAFPANGSSYLGYSHLYRPRGQPNLLPHWSNPCQPCNLYLREMWESPDQPHIEDLWVVMRWCPAVQWCGEVWCGVVCCCPGHLSPSQYFLKWLPVCSRSQHRGPVTQLFGFKTWKHKEQKATNWTKYFRSRKVFRLEITSNLHLLGRFVQVERYCAVLIQFLWLKVKQWMKNSQVKVLPDDGNYLQPTFPLLSEIHFGLFWGWNWIISTSNEPIYV